MKACNFTKNNTFTDISQEIYLQRCIFFFFLTFSENLFSRKNFNNRLWFKSKLIM